MREYRPAQARRTPPLIEKPDIYRVQAAHISGFGYGVDIVGFEEALDYFYKIAREIVGDDKALEIYARASEAVEKPTP